MEIEVLCLYMSREGRIERYLDLCSRKGWIDGSEEGTHGFWSLSGGFSITINKYNTVFSSCNFYVMVKATTFLMSTICWIKKLYSEWINKDKIEDRETFIELQPDEILKLSEYNEEEFIMSYEKLDGVVENQRGERYFKKLVINKKDWISAVTIALDEYFIVLNRILDDSPIDNASEVMKQYAEEWKRIKLSNFQQ